MSAVKTLVYFVVANTLSLFYGIITLIKFLIEYIKNPFGDPWAQKLRLEPPEPLQDPKYGVHKYAKVNNVMLHYVESGNQSKPLMLFLHGFPEFWYTWRHQIVEFKKDYWCIVIDLPGYGDSEKPEEQSAYKMETLIEDVRQFLQFLEREKCILVGHDWGSLIACKFRDVYPNNLHALIILGGSSMEAWMATIYSDMEQFRKSWYLYLMRLPCLPEMLMEMNDMEWLDKALLVEGKDTVTLQDLECYKYRFGKPTAFTPPINYYRANFKYKPPEKRKCDHPLPFLVIHAEKDLYVSAKNLYFLKRLYASIETVIIKDCSHFFNEQDPEKVNNCLRIFLSKHNI